MNLSNATFVTSAVKPDQYPSHPLPEIAFVGRSNVGKSSLINSICNKKGLARTSSSPGRTQTINFFDIDNTFYLVDLPGYGYAKVSKKVREKWGPMIEAYLTGRDNLAGVVLLVDARHEPSKDDKLMLNWFRTFDKPVTIVATKADKVKSSQKVKTFRALEAITGPFIAFSTETGEGKGAVISTIQSLLEGRGKNGGEEG